MQNFSDSSDINWNNEIDDIDRQLFEKYNLSEEDVDIINSSVATV